MNRTILFAGAVCLIAAGAFGQDATIVAIPGNSFSPSTVTITVGQTVEWQSLQPTHNAVEVTQTTWDANGTTSNGGFMSGSAGAVDTFSNTFNTTGTFFFVCQPHVAGDDMKGTVIVQAAAVPTISGLSGGGLLEEGSNVTLSATITNTADPTTFQWSKAGSGPVVDGGSISGADTTSLSFSPIASADSGSYILTVTDQSKAITVSSPITVTVVAPGALPLGGITGLSLLAIALVGAGLAVNRKRRATVN